jgi:hypothetical protein
MISSMLSATILAAALPAPPAEAQRVRWCLLCEIEETPALDTLCTMQERMIRSPSDATAIKTLPGELQRRLVRNETRWRCRCQKWRNPVCGAPPAG